MLNSELSCRQYLEEQDAATIARQVLHDHELCRSQRLPSLLALYMPSARSKLGLEIAYELYSDNGSRPRSIVSLQYSGIVQGIKAYLHQMTPASKHGPLPLVEPFTQPEPSRGELETALKVLDFCLRSQAQINVNTPVGHVIQAIMDQKDDKDKRMIVSSSSEESHTNHPAPPISKSKAQRTCYICRFALLSSHPQYPSLCRPCGDFNLASCSISLPENLDLKGKTAFVTGGRVNLGFHTALRLLRCGAKVIVSTRYPRDAEKRYMAEHDSIEWSESLKIVGADFRTAKDVFQMLVVVRDCLTARNGKGDSKLDILINNAAQTLTDLLDVEKQAVVREEKLRISGDKEDPKLLLGPDGYTARVRGGVQTSHMLGPHHSSKRVTSGNCNEHTTLSNGENWSEPERDSLLKAPFAELSQKSSWMQSIDQIPYEDIISAHSVNTFVPLILVRELLPLMGYTNSTPPTTPNTSSKSLAYIINVSSREGIFESNPNSSFKQGHHVHTNLTKAALNMLTETEAGPAWKSRRVAMNTVDPGYMSAAPEIIEQWKKSGREACPIGWEDGVGRVLWPIAAGEQGKPVWGRFLKHFGRVDVDIGVGR